MTSAHIIMPILSKSVRLSLQRMMINDDHKHTIKLMQQQPSSSSSSTVNHLQSSNFNQHLHLTQKNSISSSSSSSQIRFGLRYSCPLNEKQQQLFDQIFSIHEQTTNISECIFNQYITRLKTNSTNTLIILSGQYREISQIQNTLISLTLTSLYHFLTEENKNFILRLTIQEFSNEKLQIIKPLFLPNDYYSVQCPIKTSEYLAEFCSNHQSSSLLITFHLINRLSNLNSFQFHLFSTNNNHEANNFQEEFFNYLMSLSFLSNRQKQSFHLSNKRNSHEQTLFSLTSILNEYVINNDEHFLYILATVNNDKQLKSWTKIQRLLKTKRNHIIQMSSIESMINHSKEEIWVDGPLSSSNNKNEIWIDGPRSSKIRSTPKHRSKPMHIKAKFSPSHHHHHHHLDESNFDTESIVSSHCHLPVLPVFKDHSLLPFRSNQVKTKPLIPPESPKLNLKLSTNQLNDDLEILEKTLETLLVPSPIVSNPIDSNNNQTMMSQSLNRIEQLSSLMSHDEKNKRLSRIVSPTRFEKIFSTENHPPSVPNSPYLIPKNRHSRTPNRTLQSTKKPKLPIRTTSLADTNSRPSIFQRLFGLRSSLNSPPLSPLTVTLDSHDDLMPLTTSSTASSGRASSSGYESMSNTVLEDINNNSIKLRNKSIRKEDRRLNSPIIRDKSQYHQQRLSQLKYRQNELKIELAMTKTILFMDKNKNLDHHDAINSTTVSNSPMHTIIPNTYEEEVDELEKDIENLEKRLASTKSQLMYATYRKK